MSKLIYLEITRNFKSYYQTLRDINYYLNSDSEVDQVKLQATSSVISKLILGFIRTNGKSFREMDREQYEKEFLIFYDDFLSVIQNSGENNVDFEQFAALIDEIIGIAVRRKDALDKIQKEKLGTSVENEEVIEEVGDHFSNIDEELLANKEVSKANVPVDDKIDNIIVEDQKQEEVDNKNVEVEIENESDDANLVEEEDRDLDSAMGYRNNENLDGTINVFESDDNYRFRPRKKRFR
ncbi:hypothetical protein [Neobacillus sp. PS2-9]|uniref:hypothetical protein n=1 Tax=Neobacillus sp. PS2-9 TaxID=3070676 RepID=UPI0027DF16BF|nr:hypothetical protein [Neobacillus sp. PS2-9]WML60535.1 hypothetical protein RCG25_12565 [Neobacillus sp. PS2-9]